VHFLPQFAVRSDSTPTGAKIAHATARLLGIALIVGGAAGSAHAQGTLAVTGQVTGTPAGGGLYDYTITLQNSAASTATVGTFWYGWVPGVFYLPTSPTSVTAPNGWTCSTPSLGGIFSIEFVASTSASYIQPGGSLNFSFVSSDTPALIGGNSPAHPTTPTGTSFVYSAGPFSIPGQQFVVSSVPEPSALALLVAGAGGLWVAARRRMRG
jgi:hypothetical protein